MLRSPNQLHQQHSISLPRFFGDVPKCLKRWSRLRYQRKWAFLALEKFNEPHLTIGEPTELAPSRGPAPPFGPAKADLAATGGELRG